MPILVLATKKKFLTKIYLYNDYFEIKNTADVLHIVNLSKIKTIKIKKEDYVTFLIVEYYLENTIKTIEIEYNKNIVFYFKKNNIEIIK